MIRPERIGVEPHGRRRGQPRAGDGRARGLSSARTHELHVRIVGGDLLKATMPNDGSALVSRRAHR